MKAFGAVVIGVLLVSCSSEPVAAPVQHTASATASGTSQGTNAGPPARRFSAVAYDVSRREVVLFGGLAAGMTSYGDTWTWDGRQWTQRKPATQPAARFG